MLAKPRRIEEIRLAPDNGLHNDVIEELRAGERLFLAATPPELKEHGFALDAELAQQGDQQ